MALMVLDGAGAFSEAKPDVWLKDLEALDFCVDDTPAKEATGVEAAEEDDVVALVVGPDDDDGGGDDDDVSLWATESPVIFWRRALEFAIFAARRSRRA